MVDLDARPPATPFSEATGLLGVRGMELINITLFRLSDGEVGGTIWGTPVILLTVSGRRTGVRRTKPLLALPDDDGWILVGSRGGTTADPDWYRNLLAYERQEATGEVRTEDGRPLEAPVVEAAGRRTLTIRARALKGAERDRWWHELVAVYPKFTSYQDRASHRLIPVVRIGPG